jgi:hypothetical protein
MTIDIDELLDEITPIERTVAVCLRGDLVAEMELLETELAQARTTDMLTNEPDRAPVIAQSIEDVQQQIVAATRTFRFRALPGRDWADLIAQYPPSKDQRTDGWDYDPATFPVYAVAACAVDPVMTPTKAQQLYGKISTGQWTKLWRAVMAANAGEDRLPKSVAATVSLPPSEPSSTTAAPEASPAPPS